MPHVCLGPTQEKGRSILTVVLGNGPNAIRLGDETRLEDPGVDLQSLTYHEYSRSDDVEYFIRGARPQTLPVQARSTA